MGKRRIGILMVAIFLASVSAEAATHGEIRIKILDSETHSVVLDGSEVPKNCDSINFDAYCHNSKSTQVTNTLLVQEENGSPFRVACTIESKWSRCVPLPKGETFEAKKEKHGITVYYVDSAGKARSQMYTVVAGEARMVLSPSPPPPAPQAVIPDGETSSRAESSQPESAPAIGTPEHVASSQTATVKCSFSSAPEGAEVTVDGRYVGSTPSVLGLAAGTHVVLVKMGGFAEWKRQLVVSPGSELTVNAVLEKGN
ncbi:MAG TPA: PEGA domain-containing protein [Bryobacteraceae bacterium]|nr:PEGA domain-containing protein [Bryobacteraceae bacterium]